MKKKILFAFFVVWGLFGFAELSQAIIIFQENFDNQPEGASCDGPSLSGWGGWMCFSGTTATFDGVTHKSGEVTSPGRGGTGKSLKLWRHSGVFGDYTGVPYKGVSGDVWTTNLSDFYMRYYMKLPPAFVSSEDFKLWRLMTSEGGNEIYLNMRDPNTGNPTRSTAVLGIYDNGSGWETVLSNADLQAIWDGNWHSIEFHIGLNTHTLQVWTDGVLRHNNTNRNWTASGVLNGIQHFAIGNTFSHNGTWQNSWQAMELDDLVFADQYIGPSGGGGGDSGGTSSGAGGGGGGGSGGCFIATAAYGSYLDPSVQVLRDFRDKYLLTNFMGCRVVSFYYTYSPAVAELIQKNKALRAATRAALAPLIYTLKYPIPMFLLVIWGIAIWKRKIKRC
jgi:hypothetical protein